ncbi:MAG: type II secretion system protein [Nibricoccus sp.]
MKTHVSRFTSGSRTAFTLIEMIGVMAVMAILAAVTVPNVLKTLDMAAVRAEADSMRNLSAEVQRYTRDIGTAPTEANWSTVLQSYSELSPAELLTNKRQRDRVFLADTTTNRAMLLSVMSPNTNLALPATVSAANFQRIWSTADNAIPSSTSWSGWTAWNGVTNSHQYLVIQRINLGAELQTFPVVLKQSGTVAARYEVIPVNASSGTVVPFAVGASPVTLTLRSGQRVNLYPTASGGSPSYTYVVSNMGKTLEFMSTNFWAAQ